MGEAGYAPGRPSVATGVRRRAALRLGLASFIVLLAFCLVGAADENLEGEEVTESDPESCGEDVVDCASELLEGQFLCTNLDIDTDTQQLRGCILVNGTGKAPQQCYAVPGIKCTTTCNSNFTRYEPCNWTNGYHFDTALLLSVFLGMFGIDRFYLGYPAIGLLKFSTLGFFFIGHLVDIILIASQSLGPADGSHYVINYFGAGLTRVHVTDDTYRREQQDWY